MSAPVLAAYAALVGWLAGGASAPAIWAYAGLAVLVAVYIRVFKFSAHDGRMI